MQNAAIVSSLVAGRAAFFLKKQDLNFRKPFKELIRR